MIHSSTATVKLVKVGGVRCFLSNILLLPQGKKPYRKDFSGTFLFPSPFNLGEKYAELPREKNTFIRP